MMIRFVMIVGIKKMSKFCEKIHSKYIIEINGEKYCKKCDWGYLDTLNSKKETKENENK